MVKITNITGRFLSRKLPNGQILRWDAGQTHDVESKRLIEELEGSNGFQVGEAIGKETRGGGVATHVRPPKRRGNPPKSASKSKKVDKVLENPKSLKKPKGLKKKKGICIDLDGDGKVDVVVWDD